MTLYYCFNGLYDYEFEVDIDDVKDAIYEKFNLTIIEEAVDFYFRKYNKEICDIFVNIAYWEFLQETRCDFLDEKLMKKYKRAIREEDKMLYGKSNNI